MSRAVMVGPGQWKRRSGWDWEQYVDQIVSGVPCSSKSNPSKMDIKGAEVYVDKLMLAPALSSGLLCSDSMEQLQEGAHKLSTLVSLMKSQDVQDRSAIESARKSVRSSLGRVSESWGLSGEMSPMPHNDEGQDQSEGIVAEAIEFGRTSGCKRIMSPPLPNSCRTPLSIRHRRKQSRSLSPSAYPSPDQAPRLDFADEEVYAYSAGRPHFGDVGPEACGTLPSLLFSQEDQFSILKHGEEEHDVAHQATVADISLDCSNARLMCAQTQANCEEEVVADGSTQPSRDMQDDTSCAQDPDCGVDASTRAQIMSQLAQTEHGTLTASPVEGLSRGSPCAEAAARRLPEAEPAANSSRRQREAQAPAEAGSVLSQSTVGGLERISFPTCGIPWRTAGASHSPVQRGRDRSASMLDAREVEGMRGMIKDVGISLEWNGDEDRERMRKGLEECDKSKPAGTHCMALARDAGGCFPSEAERLRRDAVEEVLDDSIDLEQVQRLEDEALARKSIQIGVGAKESRPRGQDAQGGDGVVPQAGGESSGPSAVQTQITLADADYISETDEEESQEPASPLSPVLLVGFQRGCFGVECTERYCG